MLHTTDTHISIKLIIKNIFSLSLTMASNQLINIASGFFCMVMLAHLGKNVLAASAVIFSIQVSVMLTGMSLLFSLSILIGRQYGAKNYSEIGNYVRQGWLLAIVIGMPIIVLLSHIGTILVFLGQSKTIADIVQNFFHAYIWAVVPILLSVCNQQFCYAIHKQKLMLLSSLLGVVILLSTAYLFIFGKFGMPHYGVRGLGYAMFAQSIFLFIFTTLYFYTVKHYQQFQLFQFIPAPLPAKKLIRNEFIEQGIEPKQPHWIQIIKVGWPISLQMGGEMLSFIVYVTMVGWLGTDALSAYQVLNQYLFLIIIPIFAFSQASGILVGRAWGGKQVDQIRIIGFISIIIILLITSINALVFLLLPMHLASLYLDVYQAVNAQTLHLISLLFLLAAFSQIVDGLRNVLTGALRGQLDVVFPMLSGLMGIWLIGIPCSYILGFHLHYGVAGIAMGGIIGLFICTIIILCRWYTLSNRNWILKRRGFLS